MADVPISLFTRDPTAVLGGAFYVGLISNCGALLWCAAATCCFLGFAVVRHAVDDGRDAERIESSRFLLASGAITTLLLLDDLFQLHEEVYRVYLHVPERVVVLVYGSIVAAYFWRFRAMIRRSQYGWLILALGLLGFSAISDQLSHLLKHMRYLVEDGTKFLGIAAWFAYQSRTSFAFIRPLGAAGAAVTTSNATAEVTKSTSGSSGMPSLAEPLDISLPSQLNREVVSAFTPAAPASPRAWGNLPRANPEPIGEYATAIPELSTPSAPPIMR